MPLFDWIELPFCKVIRIESWNAPAHRYFLACESDGDFNHVLGLPVAQEFATFSSPIFFAPIPILGKIYNAGLTLGYRRSPDMDLDTGWPPLCIGLDQPDPGLPQGWEDQLLGAIQTDATSAQETMQIRDYQLKELMIPPGVEVFATDAPLLPSQLKRICRDLLRKKECVFAIAFSTGNRLTRQENGRTNQVHAVPESVLKELRNAL